MTVLLLYCGFSGWHSVGTPGAFCTYPRFLPFLLLFPLYNICKDVRIRSAMQELSSLSNYPRDEKYLSS